MRKRNRTSQRSAPAFCESLENRQLLSLTVEVRNLDGSASAVATSIGQVLNLQVLAVISSADNHPQEDSLQRVTGSFISTGFTTQSVAGDLSAAGLASFKGAPGTQQDLNGDGNLDVGGIDPFDTSQDFVAVSNDQPEAAGVVVGNTLAFEIATLTYTITNLNAGGQTSINFVPYNSFAPTAAGWTEGGVAMNNLTGTVVGGSAFTVSDPALIPPPTVPTGTFGVPINTPTTLYELTGAQSLDPLDPASVLITSLPANGTAVIQADGTIRYMPATGFQGSDSLQFTVADIAGHASAPVQVNLNMNAASAPVAMDFTQTTLANDPLYYISVFAHSTSSLALNNQVAIIQPPAHGTLEIGPTGIINYLPSENFVGADPFTYRVIDYKLDSSNIATVTMIMQKPAQPTAVDDTFDIEPNVGTTLNVLANDVAGTLGLSGSVQVQSLPAQGSLVQTDNTLVYTPTPGFTGRDSFTYLTTDTIGDPSNIATVTINVGDVPPITNNFTAAVLTGQTSSIDTLSHVTIAGGAAIAPQQSSVRVLTAPANGTATVNSDGSISYTPAAGFVGPDSFTYAVADEAGGISLPGTVTLDVGLEISNAKGEIHRLSFTDGKGGLATISLNHGTAGIFFSSTGTLATGKNGNATLAGSGLDISHFALGNTNRGSVLTIRGSVLKPLYLGQISDSSPLGSIDAPSVNVTGDITLNSVNALTLDNISSSAITIGSGSPGEFSMTAVTVNASALTSAVPINTITSLAWTGIRAITAPSINSFTIKTGGLAANISTGALGVLRVGGALTGSVSAASVGSIAVTGEITGATIELNGRGKLGLLSATSVSDSSVTASKIQAIALGNVVIDNGGTPFGVSADSIGGFSGIFGTTRLRLGRAQLKTPAALQAYLSRKGIALGDFEILLGGGSTFTFT